MFALHDVKVVVLVVMFCAACTPDLEFPDPDAGSPNGGGGSYTPPVCDQECRDYGVGLALADTVWLLYGQNIAHRPIPAGGFDTTVACPLGGNARISGELSVSDDVTHVELTYDLDACANSDSFYELAFDGSVVQTGSFDGEDFAAVTFAGVGLVMSGTVMFLDDPSIEQTCDLSATQEENSGDETFDGRVCGRTFSSVTAFDHVGGGGGSTGGPAGRGGSGGSGGSVAGAGGGGIVGSGAGCPSIYDGMYIGQFAYDYETPGPMPMTGTASFNLTLTLECMAVAGGQALLAVTRANASHAYFGCGVAGCATEAGSVAALPAQPPTTPSSPSFIGAGLLVHFPNGVILGTSNQAGELNVTSGGTTLSNAVSTETTSWSAASLSATSAFPGDGNRVTSFKSWSMSKSGLR